MLKHYLAIAVRNLKKQRLSSLINIFSLSIALSAVVIMLLWVENETSYDSFHHDAKNIYLLKTKENRENNTWVEENTPYPLGSELMHTAPGLEAMTRMRRSRENQLTLKLNGVATPMQWAIYVDSNWFNVFTYHFLNGSATYFFGSPNSLALTKTKAIQLFGKIDVVGKSIQIDSALYRVSAVVDDNPINSSFQFDVMLPMGAILRTKDDIADANFWPYANFKTFVKIRATTNVESVARQANLLYQSNVKNSTLRISMLPLLQMHFASDFEFSAFRHASHKTVTEFVILALVLLLTASINYVNLTVAQMQKRLKEISVRKIAGAKPVQLFFQIIIESVMVAALAVMLSIAFDFYFVRVLGYFTGIPFSFNLFASKIIITLLVVFLIITCIISIYPALLLKSIKPISLFRGKDILGLKSTVLKKILVTGQFSLAIFMIVATIVVYKQLAFIQQQNQQYNNPQIFTAQIPDKIFTYKEDERDAILSALETDVLKSTAVLHAVRVDMATPANINHEISGGLDWDGKPINFEPAYVSYSAEPGINEIFNYEIVQGRWFKNDGANDKNNVVLNEAAVKEFNLRQPVIGKRFNNGVIIGVAKNFYYKDMHSAIGPVVIRIGMPHVFGLLVESQRGKAKQAVAATTVLWKKYFAGESFNYTFLNNDFDKLYRDDEKALRFVSIFSALTILLCCIGLFGMMLFIIQQRQKEIGIRKLLGASVVRLVNLISNEFLKLIFIAILISFPTAWWVMDKYLQDFAYHIHLSLMFLIGAALLAFVTGFSTVSIIVTKAAMAKPVDVLRRDS